MAKPNYAYEKRQRELEKKKKKEDKALKKSSSPEGSPNEESGTAAIGDQSAPGTPSEAPDR